MEENDMNAHRKQIDQSFFGTTTTISKIAERRYRKRSNRLRGQCELTSHRVFCDEFSALLALRRVGVAEWIFVSRSTSLRVKWTMLLSDMMMHDLYNYSKGIPYVRALTHATKHESRVTLSLSRSRAFDVTHSSQPHRPPTRSRSIQSHSAEGDRHGTDSTRTIFLTPSSLDPRSCTREHLYARAQQSTSSTGTPAPLFLSHIAREI